MLILRILFVICYVTTASGKFYSLQTEKINGKKLREYHVSVVQCILRCNVDPTCTSSGMMLQDDGVQKCLLINEDENKQVLPDDSASILMAREKNIPRHTIPCGWTLVLRRESDAVSFARSWKEYKLGFGSILGDYWIGNDKLHELTQNVVRLKIDLVRFNGEKYYAEYESFQVANESQHYTMHIGGYSGNTTDGMEYLNGMKFSTLDRDNDANEAVHCATKFPGFGGWWYNQCGQVILTGKYYMDGEDVPEKGGVHWLSWKDSLKYVQMTIQRNQLISPPLEKFTTRERISGDII